MKINISMRVVCKAKKFLNVTVLVIRLIKKRHALLVCYEILLNCGCKQPFMISFVFIITAFTPFITTLFNLDSKNICRQVNVYKNCIRDHHCVMKELMCFSMTSRLSWQTFIRERRKVCLYSKLAIRKWISLMPQIWGKNRIWYFHLKIIIFFSLSFIK